MASKGVQAPSTGERKALTSVQVRESYHRRLDIHINEALDAYRVRYLHSLSHPSISKNIKY